MIDAKIVAELREKTGAGMMDAKKALELTDGNLDKAIEELRKKGVIKAAKKADRETKEGRVHAYIHSNGKVGVLVEVQCETDFVSRNQSFINFCNDLGMHIAAMAPDYLSPEDVPAELLEKEKDLYREEMIHQGKPAEVLEKIIEGKIQKYLAEICFLKQIFIKDETKTIEDIVNEIIVSLGENIQVKHFVRFQIG